MKLFVEFIDCNITVSPAPFTSFALMVSTSTGLFQSEKLMVKDNKLLFNRVFTLNIGTADCEWVKFSILKSSIMIKDKEITSIQFPLYSIEPNTVVMDTFVMDTDIANSIIVADIAIHKCSQDVAPFSAPRAQWKSQKPATAAQFLEQCPTAKILKTVPEKKRIFKKEDIQGTDEEENLL